MIGYPLHLLMVSAFTTAAASLGTNSLNTNPNNNDLHFRTGPPPPSELDQTSQYVHPKEDDFNFYDNDNWVLYTTKFRNNSFAVQPYVSNGYIGARIPVEGQGFAIDPNVTDPDGGDLPSNGWPLFNERFTGAYIAGFWDTQDNLTATNYPELLKNGSESVISTLPQWTDLRVKDVKSGDVYAANLTPSAGQINSYHQSLSLKYGIVETKVSWTPEEGGKTDDGNYCLTYTILTHRNRPNLGMVKLDVIASKDDSEIEIDDILNIDTAQRSIYADASVQDDLPAMWYAVQPNGTRNVSAYEYSLLSFSDNSKISLENDRETSKDEKAVSQKIHLKLSKNECFSVYKYVGIASTDAFPDDTLGVAKRAAKSASATGWDALVKEHDDAWDGLWDEADIIIPGDEELQISTRATLFHLLSNIREGNEGHGLGDNSIPVGGLSSDSYGGMIFWDADVWIGPGLQAIFPNYAASINNYRSKRMKEQAEVNAELYNFDGAIYPWTSGRYGNCTSSGPCVNYQYHLNFDIALSHWNYYLSTNDTEWLRKTGYPVMRDAADMFSHYVTQNGSTNGHYYTYNLTDPDEYANHVDNGGYTNGGIVQLMKWVTRASEILGEDIDPKWKDIEQKMHIPERKDLDLTLEFDEMNGTAAIKQADIVMLTYPLEYPQSETRGKTNLEYYAERQSADGPAMTYAIFAIDESVLYNQGCGVYTYLNNAHQPYLRRPYYQFSEQMLDDPNINGGTKPAFPFLTGHGGYLQVFTHGFTGFRPREDVLYLDPVLPPQIKDGVTVKGLKYQGAVFDVNVTQHETIITRRQNKVYALSSSGDNCTDVAEEFPIRIGDRNPNAGTHLLKVDESLRVATYRPDLNGTVVDGNLAECKPISSKGTWVAGKFPFAMNDGDNSTAWQPLTDESTSVTLDLGDAQKFSSAYFLWGDIPPRKVSVGIPKGEHGDNVTSAENVKEIHWVVDNEHVSLSDPWSNKTNASEIVIKTGNESTYKFGSSYDSRFVQVSIEGSYENDGKGGQVVEFALI